MSRQKNQIGSVHLIVVLVLVLALIGSLGYIAYQNFFEEKTSTQSTNNVSKSDNDNLDTTSQKTLTISEWGIVGTYTGDVVMDYSKGKNDAGADYITLTSSNVKDTDCAYSTAFITRLDKESATMEHDSYDDRGGERGGVLTIGDYTYYYRAPNAQCKWSDDSKIVSETETIKTEAFQFILSAKSI